MSQNLHRTGKRPEWEEAPASERNFWQNTATKTGGIVTPANVVTLFGLGLVCSGLNDIRRGNRLKGISKVAAGRLADVVDGAIAAKTKTKSPLGEALDASVDKLELAASLLILNQSGDLPTPATHILGFQAIAMTALTGLARARQISTHPSLAGKHATGAAWAAFSCYVGSAVAQEAGQTDTAPWLGRAGHLAVSAVLGRGAEGIVVMGREAFATRTTENSL